MTVAGGRVGSARRGHRARFPQPGYSLRSAVAARVRAAQPDARRRILAKLGLRVRAVVVAYRTGLVAP